MKNESTDAKRNKEFSLEATLFETIKKSMKTELTLVFGGLAHELIEREIRSGDTKKSLNYLWSNTWGKNDYLETLEERMAFIEGFVQGNRMQSNDGYDMIRLIVDKYGLEDAIKLSLTPNMIASFIFNNK